MLNVPEAEVAYNRYRPLHATSVSLFNNFVNLHFIINESEQPKLWLRSTCNKNPTTNKVRTDNNNPVTWVNLRVSLVIRSLTKVFLLNNEPIIKVQGTALDNYSIQPPFELVESRN